MDDRSPSMLKPTLIGGTAFGVIAGIPLVGAINCACCALVIGGGFTASWLYSKACTQAGVPFTARNGAMVGLVAGLFYALAQTVVGGLSQMLIGGGWEQAIEQIESQPDMPPEAADFMIRMFELLQGPMGIVVMFLITLLIAAVFSTIGGLIGGAVFKVEPAPPAPPAPPSSEGSSS